MSFSKELEFAMGVACESGKILMKYFGDSLESEWTDHGLVTIGDKESDSYITNHIKKEFPRHAILTEESGESGVSDHLWIIDPLDGTNNYSRGIPYFAVSIALAYKGSVVMGVIYAPVTKELFYAEKGSGAFLNGRKISVSSRPLKDSNVAFDADRNKPDGPSVLLKNIQSFVDKISKPIINESATLDLAYVAVGRYDAFIHPHCKVWDVAAGQLIVEEAGGKVTRFDGSPWTIKNYDNIIATNGKIHKEILETLKSV